MNIEKLDTWHPDFIKDLPLFDVLTNAYGTAWRTRTTWPTLEDYNQQLAAHKHKITNYQQQLIRCVPQTHKDSIFVNGYEPSLYLRGELLTRVHNWHDFFNLLVWLSFPQSKAAINYQQFHALQQRGSTNKQRTPLENKLTHIDENGVIVLSDQPELIQLLQAHCWYELFFQRREHVMAHMRFFIIGHALYEKALNPYIGLTGSGLVFNVAPEFFSNDLVQQITLADAIVSAWLLQNADNAAATKLAPLPILGVPGWWPANEKSSFYANKTYFRDKPDKPDSNDE